MKTGLIPPFDWQAVVVDPWTTDLPLFGWVALMGFLVTTACGWVGNYLMLRRLALMGDAVSHSVLPGLVVAFLWSGSRGTWAMFAGALAAGLVTGWLVEAIQRGSRVKQDAAIGITFSALFALGVVLLSRYAHQVELDADCVLYGEIGFVALESRVVVGGWELGPVSVVRMAAVALGVGLLAWLWHPRLLVSAFDPGLARTLGINARGWHHTLMAALSLVVVSAFEAVGAILVIAMLILPGATAALLVERFPARQALVVAFAALSATLGVSLAVWLDCSIAPAMVTVGAGMFSVVWLLAPHHGLIAHWRRERRAMQPPTGMGGA